MFNKVLNYVLTPIIDRKLLYEKLGVLGRQPINYTALDLELTSLDKRCTEITSMGYVSGVDGVIDLASCCYDVINSSADLGQSPVIHGLTESILAEGCELSDALVRMLPRLNDSIVVFHNARLDLAALHNAFVKHKLPQVRVLYVDTLTLALYNLRKQHQVLPLQSATLSVCRQRLGLPNFPEHNALDDALATLELYFAQLQQLGLEKPYNVKELSHTGALGVMKIGEC